jgi:hypothetical protein
MSFNRWDGGTCPSFSNVGGRGEGVSAPSKDIRGAIVSHCKKEQMFGEQLSGLAALVNIRIPLNTPDKQPSYPLNTPDKEPNYLFWNRLRGRGFRVDDF